jgi:hypothetical protein
MQISRAERRCTRRINRFLAVAIGQFCGNQVWPTQSLRRPEAGIARVSR